MGHNWDITTQTDRHRPTMMRTCEESNPLNSDVIRCVSYSFNANAQILYMVRSAYTTHTLYSNFFYKVGWYVLRDSSICFAELSCCCVFIGLYIFFPLQLSSMGGKGFIWCDGTVSKCSHPEANWKQPRAGRHVSFLCFPAGCRAHRHSWRNSTPKQPEKEVSDLRQLGYTQR